MPSWPWAMHEGGRFEIEVSFFPTVEAAARESPREDREMRLDGGTETVLLVEDEEALRSAGVRVLESQGYTVLEAANGEEGLKVYRAHAEEIDLVISDLVMPKMGGDELYHALEAEERPPQCFILASGYTGQEIGKGTALPESLPFLKKPWHLDEFLALVRDVLDDR